MRSPVRMLLLLAVALATLGAVWYNLVTPGRKPVIISVYEPPIIYAENRIQDIGSVRTDSRAESEFLLYNVGGAHLRIRDLQTSCGCTVANISKRVVAPGDFTRIRVALDTSIKLGQVRKTITVMSNDPKRSALALFLVGNVLPAPISGHQPIRLQAKDRLVLFKGDCARCHVDAGRGKTGKALFQADCAMCHGMEGQGHQSAGPSLLHLDEKDRTRVRAVIADGSPHSPQMPPFSDQHGGPLKADEIDSLVRFLEYNNRQARGGVPMSDAREAEEQAAFQDAVKNPH